MTFDESGWLVEPPTPWEVSTCYSLFSPQASSRVDAQRWSAQATRFFDVCLAVEPPKLYPAGTEPLRDGLQLIVRPQEGADVVVVQTMPVADAPAVRAAAHGAVAAMGGAGFDVLLGRAKRLWQVRSTAKSDDDLVVAALLASLFLAPILPPEADRMFGVKGARERLGSAAHGGV